MANIAQHDLSRPRAPGVSHGPAALPDPAHAVPAAGWAAATDAGRSRTHNEDCWRACPEAGVFVLADGMGGYNAGEVASAIAADTVVESLAGALPGTPGDQAAAALVRALERANGAILACAARRPECLGMGTTIAVVVLAGQTAALAHVGDSRIYLHRAGELVRLTRDHSLGQAMVDAGLAGEVAGRGPALRGVLTRALGVGPVADPDVAVLSVRDGDRLLLCSDGLTDLVSDETIGGLLGWGECADATARRLIDAALDAGGLDNVTALVVDVGAVTPER